MKKFTAFVLVLNLVIALVGCTVSNTTPATANTPAAVPVQKLSAGWYEVGGKLIRVTDNGDVKQLAETSLVQPSAAPVASPSASSSPMASSSPSASPSASVAGDEMTLLDSVNGVGLYKVNDTFKIKQVALGNVDANGTPGVGVGVTLVENTKTQDFNLRIVHRLSSGEVELKNKTNVTGYTGDTVTVPRNLLDTAPVRLYFTMPDGKKTTLEVKKL